MLFDELPVCFGLACLVEIARQLTVSAAAPLVRMLAANGTTDCQSWMMMRGEVGHESVLPVSWGCRAATA